MLKTKKYRNGGYAALADIDTSVTSPEALKAAVAEFKEEQAKKEKEQAKRLLVEAQARLDAAVETLRSYRKREKEAKANVEKFGKAMADYVKTGDWEAYQKAINTL